MTKDRPLLVTLIGGYYLIIGILGLLAGVLGSVVGLFAICFAPGMLPGGLWALITGGLNLILGGAVFSGKSWAPLVVSILAVIGIVSGILSFLGGNGLPLVMMLINGGVLFYMQGEEAKKFFTA